MATECYNQLGFGFQPKLVVDFAGGTLTTDAGLLHVRAFDEHLRLSAHVVGRITATRDARYDSLTATMSRDRGGETRKGAELLELTGPHKRQEPFHRALAVIAASADHDLPSLARDRGAATFTANRPQIWCLNRRPLNLRRSNLTSQS